MKLFLAKPGEIDKKTAYGLLGLNLVFPGLGSVFGRRKSGYFQLVLSLISFGATVHYGIKLVKWFIAHSAQAPDWIYKIPDDIKSQLWELLTPIIYALVVFFIALIWSLITNISIIKQAKENQK